MDRHVSTKWPVRSALREATGAVHERLHQARPFAALMSRRLDLAGYADLLRRIAAFHFTIAPKLELGDARTGRLARDLDVLGVSAWPGQAWRPPGSAPARLGWAYVVEGSALGGRVIYRQLDYLFGNSRDGRRYFEGCSSDRTRWQGLCDRIEKEGSRPGAIGEMIGAAADAFAMFEDALKAPVPARV